MSEEQLIQEITELRALLKIKESTLAALRREKQTTHPYGLNNEEIARYSRQIFLSEVGVQGQKKIKDSSVLIVGAGGLGCPAALYLTGAGVGIIGIVDYDNIEINNLHRQLLFTESDIGISKAAAAANALNRLNSYSNIIPHEVQLNSKNALDIVNRYDIVLDATDNVATRYLLNDACVLSGKPLISGSALRFEGHLTVYNYNGPCYRCVFPTPPPPETVTNCGDGGVLGAAVGTIGVLQALEALKIILGMPGVLSNTLLIFDGIDTKFRNIKLRAKNTNCAVCGDNPTVQQLIDYEQFCGAKANDKEPKLVLLNKEERISVEEYKKVTKLESTPFILIDVRSPEEYDICRIKNSINIPIGEIHVKDNLNLIKQEVEKIHGLQPVSVFVVCRRGNDSQKAVRQLQRLLKDNNLVIKDIIGGIHAWSRKIDSSFPIY